MTGLKNDTSVELNSGIFCSKMPINFSFLLPIILYRSTLEQIEVVSSRQYSLLDLVNSQCCLNAGIARAELIFRALVI